MMHRLTTVLALAATGTFGVIGCAQQSPSAPAPALLHGHHAGAATGFHRGHSMRAMLVMSAAVVKADPPASVALYEGLGRLDFPITTSNPTAQRFFTQGVAFAYGFNHAAAIASFREAQRLDPACAMCWWGEAFAHGPNINALYHRTGRARSDRCDGKALLA
jgi:hypothetical protein